MTDSFLEIASLDLWPLSYLQGRGELYREGLKNRELAKEAEHIFVPERAALLLSKARVRTKIVLRSRRRAKPIFQSRAV